ncbi:MAG: MFS transporter [Sphingobacteriia bacterium]|nr:MFS transporter [Sphingobacteriia bacterium]
MTENVNTKSKRIMPLLLIGVLMAALDISIVGPAIPSIEKTLWVDEQLLSWIFSIYVLANLTGIPLMSKLSDVYGRRIIYILAVLLFGLGSIVVAVSDTFWTLMVGRLIQGFGASGILPVASAVVGDIYPLEKRGRMLGLIGATFGIAFMFGPVIAGIFLKYFSWNALFLINIPIALLVAWGSWRVLPSSRFSTLHDLDIRGIVTLSGFLFFFTMTLSRLEPGSYQSLGSWILTGVYAVSSLICLLLLIRVEQEESLPVVNISLLKRRQVLLAGFIAIGLGLFQSSFVFVPHMLVGLYKVSTSTASFMLIPVVLASAVAAPVSGLITDKFGSRIVIFIGLILATIGLFITGLQPELKLLFYIAGGLIGVGFSMRTSLNYIMLLEANSQERAMAQGLLTIFVAVGQLAGASAIGAIASGQGTMSGFGPAFMTMSFLAMLMTLSSLFLKSRKREVENQ